MSAHVGLVRAHRGLDVHVGIRDAHVEITARYGNEPMVDAGQIIVLSPLVARALSKLIQTAAHEGQRERAGRPGKR